MKDSVVVFLLAGNNHLSNVKTLQSIFNQSYPHIRVVICNDCTYGFESERLLNNFEHNRPDNIEQIIFQENKRSIGEYRTQYQFWSRLNSTFCVTLHAGEYFTSPQALLNCIQKLEENPAVFAVVCGCECWDDSFKMVLSVSEAKLYMESASAADQTGGMQDQLTLVRDCMVIYRISALRNLILSVDEESVHVSREIVPMMVRSGYRVAVCEDSLCKYSEESIDLMLKPAPETLGSHTMDNIVHLLREKKIAEYEQREELFRSEEKTRPKKKRNIFVLLNKLSKVSYILTYICMSLLMFAASALFLNLNTAFYSTMGIGFFALATLIAVWAVAMLGCNLYLKKNPQRLVM